MKWLIIAVCALAALAAFAWAASAETVTGNVVSSSVAEGNPPSGGSFVLEERVMVSRMESFGDVRFLKAP